MSSAFISDKPASFKSQPRDKIEGLEEKQSAYWASIASESVIIGPESWFRNSPWYPNSKIRRAIARSGELYISRMNSGEPAGVPGMTMQADNYWRPDEEAPQEKQKKQARDKKGPKLDTAPGAPEPDVTDAAFRFWDGSSPSRLFVYYDARGVPHSVVARYDRAEGKRVRPYYWAESPDRRAAGWLDKRHPHPILYRLPQVLEGVRDDKTIVIIEGEKDVHGAIDRGYEERGYVITTNPGGAFNKAYFNAWSDVDFSPLSGAHVILVPDPDGPGSAWCEGIAACLRKLNGASQPPTVRVGTIPANWYNGYGKPWGFGDLLPAAARSDADVDAILADAVPFAQWKRPAPEPGESTSDASEPCLIEPTPFVMPDPASIPPRPWVYGNHYIRRQALTTIAASKLGKTGLLIVEALAIATGKALLGIEVRERCKVWYWNGEDDLEELQRRFTAAMLAYDIKQEDVEGWLFIDSGRSQKIIIAEQTKNGVQIATPVRKRVTERLIALDIGVLIIDPFISCHHVHENDNKAIDTVAKTWADIGGEANTGIELAHHIRKPTGAGGITTVEDARGGGSLIAAVRTARTGTRMTKEEAAKADITSESERKSIFRIDDAGGNLAPANEHTEWYKFESIELGNGDNVGVVKRWKFPGLFAGNAPSDLLAVQRAIAAGEWRESPLSKTQWAGIAVAKVLDLDLTEKAAKDRVKAMLAIWIENKALKVTPRKDKNRVKRDWIEVGEWAHQPAQGAAPADDYGSASGSGEHRTHYDASDPDDIPKDIRKRNKKKPL